MLSITNNNGKLKKRETPSTMSDEVKEESHSDIVVAGILNSSFPNFFLSIREDVYIYIIELKIEACLRYKCLKESSPNMGKAGTRSVCIIRREEEEEE